MPSRTSATINVFGRPVQVSEAPVYSATNQNLLTKSPDQFDNALLIPSLPQSECSTLVDLPVNDRDASSFDRSTENRMIDPEDQAWGSTLVQNTSRKSKGLFSLLYRRGHSSASKEPRNGGREPQCLDYDDSAWM